jgi:putative ABC transport system permease protein
MFGSYLKMAWKVLLRRRFFTFISLFGIAVTLMVLMTVTAIVDHTFGPMAPETQQHRTLGVYQLRMEGERSLRAGSPGHGFLDRFVRTLPGVDTVSIFTDPDLVASFQTGVKTELHLKRTDGEYWQILQFEFLEGGPFTVEDEARGNPVAVINASTRERLFAGQPAVGRELTVDGQRFRVVGVVANVSYLRRNPFSDVWVPLTTAESSHYRERWFGNFSALILARERRDFSAIRSELASRLETAELPEPDRYQTIEAPADTYLETVARQLLSADDTQSPAPLLWASLALLMLAFMLLPSVNLVNINVSRILERASEIGVRKAFGATKRSLVAQFVLENLVLTLLGGLLGLALSCVVLELLSRSQLIPYAAFALNWRVFLSGLGIATIFGLLSGAYPAWRMSGLHPVDALRGGER